MQIIYLVLAIVGLVLPYSQLIPFFTVHGFDLSLFWSQLFINRISACFAFDVAISSAVFWFFVFSEGRRLQIRFLWLYLASNLLIGLSFALPLFCLVRRRQIDNFATFNSVTAVGGEAV